MKSLTERIPAEFLRGAVDAAKAVAGIDRVLIAAHVNPDGDAIGAMAACGFILRRLGRRFALYSPTGLPVNLDFVHLPGPVYRGLDSLPFAPGAGLYVDCCEPHRLGAELERVWNSWPTVNIDHHISPQGMGSLANFIDTAAAASCQLVAYTASALDLRIDGDLAKAVGLGILTDTGTFSHRNTTAAVFDLCAEMEKNGCRIAEIMEKLRDNWDLGRLRLWGELLVNVHQSCENRVAWSVIFEDDIKRNDCRPEDLEGYVDWLRLLRGNQIALTVRQTGPDSSKFSMRSARDVNIQQIAAELGGGGHRNAAGGSLPLPPWPALWKLLETIDRKYCDGRL